ncbi:furin-like protease 1 isoform X2 [Diorhabda carinulata]|uniref:furin-like protease 1 isoform X2 n=1 Tax=Diorhabda carinulata TaxID=1163345 RepID=UPI0025A058AC|nr:furin-like protease 1 isoform X2 [Diorhabda carinulata]XP_057655599.1 furin-like protease 1 isoform X2 [Diorhabda carinulata]
MRHFSYFCIGVFLCIVRLTKTHYTQQWAVHIEGGSDVADAVARDHGFVNHGLIFKDHYHFSHNGVAKRSLNPSVETKIKLAVDTRVSWAQQQTAKRRVKRDFKVQDSDPKWPFMWYLNRGGGLDMNVIPAWMEGITGKGAVVTILDDGLEKDHPDLLQNYDPMASYDVNGQDSDPSPRYDMIDSNRHGTRCAGEVAATSNNSVCALGVAHGAQVGGVRMLDGEVTDAVEARSLSLNPHHIDIYSASWGPDDDGKTVDGPGELATRAFIEGVTKGRNGKGSIFIWASGNGGRDHDNCNCDGYTNSIYSLSISSVTENGHVPWYSEACSSTLASTYSSGALGEKQVVTTDLRHSCTSSHTGTSASAPLAAGICALALEANPNLTWRDMQHIVVRTARPQNLIATDWRVNGVGRHVSHSFGYGLMDAYAMVQMARNWTTVPEQHKCEVTSSQVPKMIPARSMVVLQLQVNECAGVEVLEHVQAKLTIDSQRRGDLNIHLTSPAGTKVDLLAHRPHDNSRAGFSEWPFMSVHSWGESPIGSWQLEIHNDGRMLGKVHYWQLTLYGTETAPLADNIPSKEGSNTIPNKVNEEVLFNTIYDSASNWESGAENRKDVLEVEEKETSGCSKSKGNLCLDCFQNFILYKGFCIKLCPRKFYNNLLEMDTPEQIKSLLKNQTCSPCHYTCLSCKGSLDSDCTECYNDAEIVIPSTTESYCYPVGIVSEVLSEKWYHRVFTMMYVLIILAIIPTLLYLWIRKRRNDNKKKLNYLIAQNIERENIKTTAYSDDRP